MPLIFLLAPNLFGSITLIKKSYTLCHERTAGLNCYLNFVIQDLFNLWKRVNFGFSSFSIHQLTSTIERHLTGTNLFRHVSRRQSLFVFPRDTWNKKPFMSSDDVKQGRQLIPRLIWTLSNFSRSKPLSRTPFIVGRSPLVSVLRCLDGPWTQYVICNTSYCPPLDWSRFERSLLHIVSVLNSTSGRYRPLGQIQFYWHVFRQPFWQRKGGAGV